MNQDSDIWLTEKYITFVRKPKKRARLQPHMIKSCPVVILQGWVLRLLPHGGLEEGDRSRSPWAREGKAVALNQLAPSGSGLPPVSGRWTGGGVALFTQEAFSMRMAPVAAILGTECAGQEWEAQERCPNSPSRCPACPSLREANSGWVLELHRLLSWVTSTCTLII